jgi:hypothetical protein
MDGKANAIRDRITTVNNTKKNHLGHETCCCR